MHSASALLPRRKLQRGGVHAEAGTAGLWAVWKNMSEMGIAMGANDLVANHAMAGIAVHGDALGIKGSPETRPSGARLEFGFRAEERLPTTNAVVGALSFAVPIFSGERRLGAFLPGNRVLFGRESRAPFVFGMSNFFRLFGHDQDPSFAVMVILAFSTLETGQPLLAFSAAF